MTAKRDLKKRVRERQERTGERYTTARAHVLAGRPLPAGAESPRSPATAIPVVEFQDISPEAGRLGFKCRIVISPKLATLVDCSALLERIRDLLLATAPDRDTELLRSVMLRGERPTSPREGQLHDMIESWRRLIVRARAGIGGVSEGGGMMALYFAGHRSLETVLCFIWPTWPAWLASHPWALSWVLTIHPTVVLTIPGELTFEADLSALSLP